MHFRILPLALLLFLTACQTDSDRYTRWSEYLGGPDRNHYSTLDQITPDNVHHLKVAWTYAAPDSGQMQMNPIMVDGVLYGVTAAVQAFALDAATGRGLWRFGDTLHVWHSTSRGLSYWAAGDDRRIFFTAGPNLFALDARTGRPVDSFGDHGKVDLHTGLPESAREKFIISNTPGAIFENLIIMPVRLSEGPDAAPGDIRAFDVRSGALVWTFHTIPYPGEHGYETWKNPKAYLNTDVGAANNWAGMSVDPETGIVYVPTGSASPDFYGGRRRGANLYSDCLLALNARTGERIWHYQFVHHDIWDRDLPAPPNLITVKRGGKKIPAVAQITKQGYVFVFDRKTGQPLFDIEEKAAPPSGLDGEEAWPTQPVPVLPKPFARQADALTEADISPFAADRDALLEAFRKADKRLFAPPTMGDGVLLLPGYDGGGEWGGAAADPDEGILYVNANEMAWLLRMEPATPVSAQGAESAGAGGYRVFCSGCHRPDRRGNAQSGYPALLDARRKFKASDLVQLITTGKGMMPGFPQIPAAQKAAIAAFVLGLESAGAAASGSASPELPYRHTGYHKFLDAAGLPGLAPPWGTLSAIDLNTGEYRWQVPLGEIDSLRQKGVPPTGTENYGGAVVTANGLLFIAATKDSRFRAFDKTTGRLLWETELPASAFATPAMYETGGRQYIVVACGGGKLNMPKGNRIVAFTLE